MEAETQWTLHCKDHKITARGCPATGEYSYESRYSAWIKINFSGFFATWQAYDSSKTIMHYFSKLSPKDRAAGSRSDFWSEYRKAIGQVALFSSSNFPLPTLTVAQIHVLVVAMEKHFKHMPMDFQRLVLVEFTKLCLLTRDARPDQYCFRSKDAAKALVTNLICDMRESVTVKSRLAKKVDEQTEEAEEPAKKKPKGNKKQQSAISTTPKKKEVIAMDKEIFWLTDVHGIFADAAAGIQVGELMHDKSCQHLMSNSLQFCGKPPLKLNNKELKKWSILRALLSTSLRQLSTNTLPSCVVGSY